MTMTAIRRIGRLVRVGALLVVAAAVRPAGADWPQFLGPNRNGVGPEGEGLARSWPADGPKVLWRTPVGEGYAGPAIHGESVLILDREDNQRDVLRRIRLADGEEVWRREYDAPGKLDRNGSRTTPATDGKTVFSVGPFGHILAAAFTDGEVVWQADLLKDWGAGPPNWGVSQSPLLLNGSVIFAPWGAEAAIVAYGKADGKVLWKTPNSRGIKQDYSSPVPMKIGGKEMIVASGKNGATIGVEPGTGKELWFFDGYKCRIHIPSPVALDQGRVLLTGGYGSGSAIFHIRESGGAYETRRVWRDKRFGAKIAQAILYKGSVYCPSGDTRGNLRCITPDGKPKWDAGDAGTCGQGSMIVVDGLMFILHGDSGDLIMAEANPKEYRELGRARLLGGPNIWAPLAYSDGKLVIRDQRELVCVALK